MRKTCFIVAALWLLLPVSGQAQGGCVSNFPSATADAVVQACTRIIEAAQGSKTELAAAHASRAIAYLIKNDLDGAERDADEALALDPGLAAAHYSRGGVYMQNNAVEAAMAELDTAIKIDPDDAGFYNNRGSLEIKLGRYDAAISDFSEGIRLKPESYIFYHDRRLVLQMANRYADAVPDADKVKQLAPDIATNWNNACWARAIWGQELEVALPDCDKAVAMAPANASFLDSRCFVKYRMERYDDAVADCTAALKINPRLAAALYVRGLALMKSGHSGDGSDDIEAARRLGANVEEVYARYGVKP